VGKAHPQESRKIIIALCLNRPNSAARHARLPTRSKRTGAHPPSIKGIWKGVLNPEDEISKELNIVTTQTNARRFNPIFTATVTPASVSTRTASNGNKYAVLSGASIAFGNGRSETRTVMAFGAQRDEVASLLRKGRPVELALQRDGGTVRVVGLPRAAAA
jgi:hypothetical protein